MPRVVKKLVQRQGVDNHSDENESDSNVDIQNGCNYEDSKASKTNNSSMSKMGKASANSTACIKHAFDKSEIANFRILLMEWYDREQRALPWRITAKTEADLNKRIYSVWVSEVMLQQTQVATMLPYYQTWLAAWPTVESLSSAQLHDVHKCWAGLGYYSRATRLHQSAQKVGPDLPVVETSSSASTAPVDLIRLGPALSGTLEFIQTSPAAQWDCLGHPDYQSWLSGTVWIILTTRAG